MATTKIFSRARKSTQASATAAPGKANAATFNSVGLASVDNPAAYLSEFGDVNLAGTVHFEVVLDSDGTAAESDTYTVPAGKQWRLLSCVFELITDGTTADRQVRLRTRTDADVAIETFTQAVQTASTTTRYQLAFEDDTQGATRVEPTGTLTIAEQVAAADTFSINGVTITLVAVGSITASHQIEIGATEAASKLNFNAALGATPTKGNHSITADIRASMEVTAADFSSDDMVFTYAGPGSATGDGEAVALAETFAGATNVWDSGDTTLGGVTAGVGAGTLEGSTRFPANGTMLEAGEDININVLLGVAGDDLDYYLTYIEYDAVTT